MKYIACKFVRIEQDRQRQDFSPVDMLNLKTSIESDQGLLHAIIIRSESEPVLVAGERRLKAVMALGDAGIQIKHDDTEVPLGYIPYTELGALSDIQYEEAELDENLQRCNLSWQEEATAIAKLHALRCSQTKGDVSNLDIGKELVDKGVGQNPVAMSSKVSESRIISKHLNNPEVQKAKSQAEAIKVIKKLAAKEKLALLAAKFDPAKVRHNFFRGDCREALRQIPSGSFDCIITDPPYGVGADTFGSQSDAGHSYNDDTENSIKLYTWLAKEGYRMCKDEAHAYVFCDSRVFSFLCMTFKTAGWTVFPTPLIWAKSNGMLPLPDHGPRRTYECILYARKGNKKVLKVAPDVINLSGVATPRHGAEKPVELFCDLLERSCHPGDKILDPFAGSGTVFPAANKLQLIATAVEFDEHYANLAESRIEEGL